MKGAASKNSQSEVARTYARVVKQTVDLINKHIDYLETKPQLDAGDIRQLERAARALAALGKSHSSRQPSPIDRVEKDEVPDLIEQLQQRSKTGPKR